MADDFKKLIEGKNIGFETYDLDENSSNINKNQILSDAKKAYHKEQFKSAVSATSGFLKNVGIGFGSMVKTGVKNYYDNYQKEQKGSIKNKSIRNISSRVPREITYTGFGSPSYTSQFGTFGYKKRR